MEEEDEDRVLLSALGVTPANPEDIERGIIEKAREDDRAAEGKEEELNDVKCNETPSSNHKNLVNKLRVVKHEIDAVRYTIEHLENFQRDKNHLPDDDDKTDPDNAEGDTIVLQSSSRDLTRQHALAADRLQSLIKMRAQLEKEISDSSKNNQDGDRLIRNLVKEVPKSKRGLEEADKTSRNKNKRFKKISVDEGDDFEAILNAASVGFVETDRDELVWEGILTPFHKLKGYERRIQEQGSSGSHTASEDPMESNDLASSSIARAVQLMTEASKTRPATKMLDPGRKEGHNLGRSGKSSVMNDLRKKVACQDASVY